LSACSEREEDEWKDHIRHRIVAEAYDFAEGLMNTSEHFSCILPGAKSLGPAFEANGGFARRKSIHRAATLGPKTNLHQVIIKNTNAQKLGGDDNVLPMMRSQSHMSASHIPTLAPRRTERIRLEAALGEIWTRDVLPYPGMTSGRMETHIRASANSVIRKLSMASIASNFSMSKRSNSFTSLTTQRIEESGFSTSQRSLQSVSSITKYRTDVEGMRNSRPSPVVVDFHNTPSAFLPEDFELKPKQNHLCKRRRMANRAGTSEVSDVSKEATTPRQMTPIGVYLDKSKENHHLTERHIVCQTPVQMLRAQSSTGGASIRTPDRSDTTAVPLGSAIIQAQEHMSPPTFQGPTKCPVKARSLLFKFLAMVKE
jgi:hypothetical protein